MHFDISHEGRTTLAVDYAGALDLGYPAASAGAALKSAARAEVARIVDGYRSRLASPVAGKLAEYRFKEEIARDPASADPTEMAIIDREAEARGMSRAALLTVIAIKARALRQAALLVAAVEVEAAARLQAVADDAAEIEQAVDAALMLARDDLRAGLAEALRLTGAS